jgi:hypothetical protein
MRKKLALVLVLVALGISASLFACSQTPTPVPVRTMERAQRVDVVCLQLGDPVTGEPQVPVPRPQIECAPVPPNSQGNRLPNQLFALVTQSTRGEVAVVNLTAGELHDLSRATPGINFLPVGAVPTDVAATPDGAMIFVASAEPNKAAIYGIPSRRILGDKGFVADPDGAISLASWPVCALPQRPGALSIVPRRAAAEGDAGGALAPPYEVVAVLPGDRRSTAKVVTIDPWPFLRAARVTTVLRGGQDEAVPEGPALEPGALEPCPITSAIELLGEEAVPFEAPVGTSWPNGVPYVEGGFDLTCELPRRGSSATCGLRPCCPEPLPVEDGGLADGGLPLDEDAGACAPVEPRDAGEVPLDLAVLEPPRPVAAARDDQTLYVADDGVPLVHVIDLTRPGELRELPPLVATSLADPARVISIRDLAVSPPTRDYKRYLYAIDKTEGSLMVFDVTDPETAERVPLTRPNPELNPFQPPDRIAFNSPVVAVSFARHDFPVGRRAGVPIPSAVSGVLCNPNPNAVAADGTVVDPGAYFRADSTDPLVGLGPARLRGIFGFATLANGNVVVIDVDDWDAPCRRPVLLGAPIEGVEPPAEGSLAAPQPAPGPDDLDPYHAPFGGSAVSGEAYFPVSVPHRMRSRVLLRVDSPSGRQVPFLTGLPLVDLAGTPLPLIGPESERTPRMRPTAPGEVEDPALDVGVSFSLETPEVHIDQDWSVTYEGVLPGFDGITASMETSDYHSLVLRQPQGRFCGRGVEDWSVGITRAEDVVGALERLRRPTPAARYERRVTDYVQITDELLPPSDPYWAVPNEQVPGQCWDPRLDDARVRYDACSSVFGTLADESEGRDFPILEAYDDRLVLGRFYTPPAAAGTRPQREVVYTDASNAQYLRLLRCCFHNQARFQVRAASQWVAVGDQYGLLHHVETGEGGRCVRSCDPAQSLLDARAPAIPFAADRAVPPRDSATALRNPVFSFVMENGVEADIDRVPVRGTRWRFSTRGQFQPLVINLAGQTVNVNPQSMRFIEALGQMAVVDGAAQGLVLIDLAGVRVARDPYF